MKIIDSIKNVDVVFTLLVSITIVHVVYLILFTLLGITPMQIFNIGSVITYCIVLILHKQNRTSIASFLTCVEITSHQIYGIYLTGFNSGFVLVYLCLFLFQFSILKRWLYRVLLTIFGYAIIIALLLNKDKLTAPYVGFNDILFSVNIFVIGTFLLVYGTLATLAPASKISELIDLVYHDQLTGLFNRKYFHDKLCPQISNASNPYVLAICDIDNFKNINDTFGHENGDLALKLISSSLLASGAKVVRWGGEEFVILMDTKSYLDGLYALDEIRKSVCEITFLGKKQLSISIGAVYQDSADDYKRLLQMADTALYRCKQGTKNCVELFDMNKGIDNEDILKNNFNSQFSIEQLEESRKLETASSIK